MVRIRVVRASMAAALLVTSIAASAVTAAGPVSVPIYDNVPGSLPGNLPSLGFEATSTSELGAQVGFAGTARNLDSVTVTMSSWACESGGWPSTCTTTPGATFSVPITFTIYAAGPGNAVGAVIAARTQTFDVPYRPSSDPSCTGGRWKEAASGTCYNGMAFNIVFDFSASKPLLPDSVVYGVAYNTAHHGYSPTGVPGGYDSLNVATFPGTGVATAPLVGATLPDNLSAYWNTTFAGFYCDNGSGGTGSFRIDAGCWEGYIPAVRFSALLIAPPPSAAACKKDGWKAYTRADGSAFKNQGDCIQFVNTGK